MLKIMKASAGSGKTYRLARKYISLLLKSKDRYAYRHILAVTFTNKATDEMKGRILKELHVLATRPHESGYHDHFVPSYFPSDTELQKKAEIVLSDMLHDYSAFAVSTIDRFFQQALKAFSREIGQFASYQVELDKDSLVAESVDRILDSLTEEDSGLLSWLTDNVLEQIEQGGRYSMDANLMEMAKRLKSAQRQDVMEKSGVAADKEYPKEKLLEIRDACRQIVSDFRAAVKAAAKAALDVIGQAGVNPAESNRGFMKKLYQYSELEDGDAIEALPETFTSKALDHEQWFAKTKAAKLKPLVYPFLEAPLEDFCTLFDKAFKVYNTAQILDGQLYGLGVAGELDKAFKELMKEKNVLCIDDSNTILRDIIDGSDAPFVYEKLGVRYEHFLLDEFQDTAGVQWSNFSPLLHESESKGGESLIVGDVKQSIYRWRNSDWSLLKERLYRDFQGYDIKDGNLRTSRRSYEHVVRFNNSFFGMCARELQNKFNKTIGDTENTLITNIYSTDKESPDYFEQEYLESKGGKGHVKVSFIESDGERDWKEVNLERLVEDINILKGNGWSYKDMAVLVRTNKEGSAVAGKLLDAGFKIVSDDSLVISASKSVQKLVTALKYISSPEDPLVKFIFNGVEISASEKSLYNICEEIARQMSPEDMLEGAFLQAFMDSVLDYTSANGSDLDGFVKWWDEVGRKRSISAPEGDDAIRIITIHKSKGLGYDVVLVPFFDEPLYDSKVEDRGKILWCTPGDAPFNEIKILPIASSSKLLNTVFAEDYKEEVLYSYIDKINVAYVAFTRAKTELIVYPKVPKFDKDGNFAIASMADVLYMYCGEELEYEEGEWFVSTSHTSEKSSSDEPESGIYKSVPIGDRLKLALAGGDFFSIDSSRGRGVVMHDVLAKIATEEDLDDAVDEAVREGLIDAASRQEILDDLHKRLKSVAERHWFDGTYDFHNEIDILLPGGEFRRPDRIMTSGNHAIIVDYKFGHLKSKRYIYQVQDYKKYLLQMGYTTVEGYIWYLEDNEIVEVN